MAFDIMTLVTDCSSALVELRQYTLRPGRRTDLIEIFAREFVDEHERVGSRVLGYFRDLDNPDRFVWLRGFPEYAARPAAMDQLYGGERWMRWRYVINAMLLDSDNVLQLRPLGVLRPANEAGMVVALVMMFEAPIEDSAAVRLVSRLAAGLDPARATPFGTLVSDPRPNNFPPLPLREGEHAVVFLTGFAAPEAADAWACDIGELGVPNSPAMREPPLVLGAVVFSAA
jgi:hypothetical protein